MGATCYRSIGELLDDATSNPDCAAFLEHCLALRRDKRSRHTLTELMSQRLVGATKKVWFKPLCRNIFAVYRLERALMVQQQRAEKVDMRSITRKQRSVLAVSGLLRTRRAPTSRLAVRNRQVVAEAVRPHGALVWIDNFNKFRYGRNVNEERNHCINGTVMAILPLKSCEAQLWSGWMSLSRMFLGLRDVDSKVLRATTVLANEVKTLKQTPLQYDAVRAPCDVRRLGATNLPWWPWSVHGDNVGSTEGLLRVLLRVVDAQRQLKKLVPILVDINVYYRVMKLLYNPKLLQVNVRGALTEHPLLFGLWHAYAHCLKRTFWQFRSCWAALEYAGFVRFPTTTKVYLKPKVDALEQMVVAMYLIHGQRQAVLRHTVAQCRTDFGEGSRAHCLAQCMELLLGEYVPCLFTIGLSVRECYWSLQQPNTGARARQILSFCLTYLLALEKSYRNEYCRVISMTLLTWTPWHSSLPAALFVEEHLEASLSRLQRFCATDLRTYSVDAFSAAYAALGRSEEKVDLVQPHVGATLPDRVLIRLDKVVAALLAGNMPSVVGVGVKGTGSLTDAAVPFVPKSPLHGVGGSDVQRCMYHAMYTLLAQTELDNDLLGDVNRLCVHVPPLGADAVVAATNLHEDIKGRLRRVLRLAPTRRSRAVPVQQAASSSTQVPTTAVAPTMAADDDSDGAESSGSASSTLRETDASGMSSPPPSPACTSGSGEYTDSDDSRSPACTSGRGSFCVEDGEVDDLDMP